MRGKCANSSDFGRLNRLRYLLFDFSHVVRVEQALDVVHGEGLQVRSGYRCKAEMKDVPGF